MFYNLKKFMPESAMIKIYDAFYKSRIQYGITLYSAASQNHLKPVITSQKFAIRMISNATRYEHSAPLFKAAKILPFVLLSEKQILISFLAHFKCNFQLSLNQRTRQSINILSLPKYNKTKSRKAFLYKAVSLYNNIVKAQNIVELQKKNIELYINNMLVGLG